MNQQTDRGEFDFDLPMSVADIEKCVPHRYPFLLVDRVVAYDKGEAITAYRNISMADPLLQGHFPGNPILPGVIMIEGLAQASAVLGKLTKGTECDTCLLMEISDTRFRKMVVPGDVLYYNVKVVKRRKDFFWFEGVATVDGEVAASAKFSAKLS